MPLAVERGEHRPFRRVVPEAEPEAEAEAEAAEIKVTAREPGDTSRQCSQWLSTACRS